MLWVAIASSLCCSQVNSNEGVDYPTGIAVSPKIWSRLKNSSWVCGNSIKYAIQCQDDSDYIKIARCYCIYYDPNTNSSQFGHCMATCFHPQFGTYFTVRRYSVENASLFNRAMCVESSSSFQYITNRSGRFCGSCQEGHGLSVYSYQWSTCIPCKEYHRLNWVKYLAVSLVPLVGFYFLVVLMKINFTSSYLSSVVASVQIMASPVNLYILEAWGNSNLIGGSDGETKLYIAMYGPLNLDFFRDLYSPFCLDPSFSAMQVISLDYISGVFPFILIILTYFLIKFYDRHYFLVVWAWKPFKYILNKYHRELSVRTSLVETFATFILLSSVKIASTSLFLLVPVTVYNEDGIKLSRQFLYADSNLEWFGREHLPYGVLGLTMGFIFVFIPLVLMLLYPCRCFQKILNRLGLNSPALRVFMDAFQGCYRLEPYDMRYFSAYYLFLRIFIPYLTASIQSIFSFSATTLCLVINAIFVFSVQPCRSPTHNKIDCMSMHILAFFYVSVLTMNSTFYLDIFWIDICNFAFGVAQVLIAIFFIGIFTWTFLGSKLRIMLQKLKTLIKRKKWLPTGDKEREDSLLSFSERSSLTSYDNSSVAVRHMHSGSY